MNMQELQHIWIYVADHWPMILNYSVNGLSICVILQWVKRHYHLDERALHLMKLVRLNGKQIVMTVLTVLTVLDMVINYLIDPRNAAYIPKQFAFIVAAALFIHRFMVSPAGQRLERAMAPYWLALQQIKDQKEKTATEAAPSLQATTPAPFTLPEQQK